MTSKFCLWSNHQAYFSLHAQGRLLHVVQEAGRGAAQEATGLLRDIRKRRRRKVDALVHVPEDAAIAARTDIAAPRLRIKLSRKYCKSLQNGQPARPLRQQRLPIRNKWSRDNCRPTSFLGNNLPMLNNYFALLRCLSWHMSLILPNIITYQYRATRVVSL